MLSGSGFCDELIPCPEESYRLWCVVVCDEETSRMWRPWPALGRSATGKKNTIFSNTDYFCSGRDSAVGTATLYELDGPVIESWWGARFSAPFQTGPGAHPAFYIMGTRSFPGAKRPGRGVYHPPHLAPRLKEEWSYTSTPPLDLRGLF